MSALTKPAGWISPEEYLEGEFSAEQRHEYVDGYVYAMAGASIEHVRIVMNLGSELRERLRGGPCEAVATDMKVKIPPSFADVFYYPDIMVLCDRTDNSLYYRERPFVIFEVLSPDTERTDRGEKAVAYRHIPGLQAYVLVEQNRMAVTILHRTEPGWRPEIVEGPNAVLRLFMIGVEIPLERIYERTRLEKRD